MAFAPVGVGEQAHAGGLRTRDSTRQKLDLGLHKAVHNGCAERGVAKHPSPTVDSVNKERLLPFPGSRWPRRHLP